VIAPALALTDITKRFGALVALDHASLSANWGTVHALLGENGAGKTTLMRVAFGMIRPDTGTVTVDGIARRFGSPTDAIRAGIGMVHQHFALVGAMTVAENVALGSRGLYDASAATARVHRLSADTGLSVDPDARVDALSIEEQQRVEVMKALARDARILVLDEPTAVLSPPRASELLQWLRRFADGGRTVVLITHNLRDALSVADDVTVLRRGRTVLAAPARSVDDEELARAMLGQVPSELPHPLTPSTEGEGESPLFKLRLEDEGLRPSTPLAPEIRPAESGDESRAEKERIESAKSEARTHEQIEFAGAEAGTEEGTGFAGSGGEAPTEEKKDISPSPLGEGARGRGPVIVADDVSIADSRGITMIRNASFSVRGGEIVGIAALEGAGQHELLRALAGRAQAVAGTLATPGRVGFIPEDRQRDALVLSFPLYENVALRGAGRRRGRVRWRLVRAHTASIVAAHDIRPGNVAAPASALSGGNQQKLVLARELDDNPSAVIADNPTRGLDIQATAAVHTRLRSARDRGAAVVLYSSDIDEMLALADRVLVIAGGQVRGVVHDRDAVGRAMLGAE
jgi:general nucleoside transport system ATP-binding protein